MRNHVYKMAMLLAAMFAHPDHASAQMYKFKTIDYIKKYSTLLEGINKSDTIIGDYLDNKGNFNCFTISGSMKTLLMDPGAKTTGCFGINDGGDIVGFVPSGTLLGKAFLYSGGNFTSIKPPNSSGGAIAYGISGSGTIIGTYVDSSGNQHGFLLTGKKFTSFDAPGQVITLGIDVNDHGQYTVQSEDSSGNEHSFIYSGGQYSELLFPSATSTRAHAINNSGQVAIGWIDSSGNENGGVYDSKSGTYYTVNRPGEALTGVEGINDKQTLVGIFASPTDSVYEGFKATGKLTK